MSTSDLTVTLVGWVGTEPKHYTGTGVTPFTSFRMANTRRYVDRATGTWTDGRTEWFTVKLWRQSALNAASSLRKGDPVLVHGRLSTEQWDGPDGPRTSLVLEALAIGPDLTFGRASFARTVHVGGAEAAAAESDRLDGGADHGERGSVPNAGPDDLGLEDLGPDDPWATGAATGAATDAGPGEATADVGDGTDGGASAGPEPAPGSPAVRGDAVEVDAAEADAVEAGAVEAGAAEAVAADALAAGGRSRRGRERQAAAV